MKPISANSRFQITAIVDDETGEKTHYSEWKPIRLGDVAETLYVVSDSDLGRPDLISWRNYGVSDLWWVILFYNEIIDPFSLEVGDRLRIPNSQDVEAILATARVSRLRLARAQTDKPDIPIPVATFPTLPTLRRVLTAGELRALTSGSVPVLNDQVVYVYGFEIPMNLIGSIHFQLQLSTKSDFTALVLNRFTATSQKNWYYFNPAANNTAGGFIPFPPGGVDGVLFGGQQVYLNIFSSDSIRPGTEYFARYRTWIDNVESDWYSSPPILF
jgi:hypothetical protein